MRDFALPATPAIARRLIEVSRIDNLIVSPEITTLSQQGMILPAEFDQCPLFIGNSFRDLTQKLVDYDANAIICFDDRDIGAIHNSVVGACHLMGLPMVVAAHSKQKWPNIPNIEYIKGDIPRGFFTKARRGGVLVMDQVNTAVIGEGDCREFQHIIVLQGLTLSNYRSRYSEQEFLSKAVMTLHGLTSFETVERRAGKCCYPYFNIIDLVPVHK